MKVKAQFLLSGTEMVVGPLYKRINQYRSDIQHVS